jgi:hypothetical protein
VCFQPPIPGPQRTSITARTLAGRSFTLPITANGVQPALSASHNRITFPATPVNDVRTVAILLRNSTAVKQVPASHLWVRRVEASSLGLVASIIDSQPSGMQELLPFLYQHCWPSNGQRWRCAACRSVVSCLPMKLSPEARAGLCLTLPSLLLLVPRSQAFEFGVPPGSALHFVPRVGEVPALGSLRVQVRACVCVCGKAGGRG